MLIPIGFRSDTQMVLLHRNGAMVAAMESTMIVLPRYWYSIGTQNWCGRLLRRWHYLRACARERERAVNQIFIQLGKTGFLNLWTTKQAGNDRNEKLIAAQCRFLPRDRRERNSCCACTSVRARERAVNWVFIGLRKLFCSVMITANHSGDHRNEKFIAAHCIRAERQEWTAKVVVQWKVHCYLEELWQWKVVGR